MPGRGRRGPAARVAARGPAAPSVVAGACALIVLFPTPAGAHEVSSAASRPWTGMVGPILAGGALVVTTVALAGLLSVGLVAGRSPSPDRARVRGAEGWLAGVAAVCDLAVLAGPAALDGMLGGWQRWVAAVHLVLVLVVLGGWCETSPERWGTTLSFALPQARRSGLRRRSRRALFDTSHLGAVTRARWASGALAAGLALTLVAAGHAGRVGWGRLVEWGVAVAHVAAAAVWVGVVVHVALGWRRGPGARAWVSDAVRRLAPVATAAAVVTLATGVGNVAVHEAWSVRPRGSAYGAVLAAKVALLVPTLVGAGALVRRWAEAERRGRRLRPLGALVTAEAGGFVVVLALASGLLFLPSPAALREPGVDLLRAVRLGERRLTVSVAPQRAGANVVQVLGAGVEAVSVTVGGRGVTLQPDGTGGAVGVAWLPAGRSTLRLTAGGFADRIGLETGRARGGVVRVDGSLPVEGPDRAECASRHLGRQVAVAEANAAPGPGARRQRLRSSLAPAAVAAPAVAPAPVGAAADGCGGAAPAGGRAGALALEPTPAEAAAGFVRFLAAQGAGRVVVVADGSRRAGDFAQQAGVAGASAGVVVEVVDPHGVGGADGERGAPGSPPAPHAADAAVVATGWEDAARVTGALSEPSLAPARGVYLAPWLLKPDLLEGALGRGSVQLSFGAALAPTSAPASAYLGALRRFAPGAVPTGPGMAGYLETRLVTASRHDRRELERLLSPVPPLVGTPSRGQRAAERAGPTARLELFTPVRLGFLPEEVDAGHNHGDASTAWLPGVTLAPIGTAPRGGT